MRHAQKGPARSTLNAGEGEMPRVSRPRRCGAGRDCVGRAHLVVGMEGGRTALGVDG